MCTLKVIIRKNEAFSKALFALDDCEHALMLFHRVKRWTNGFNKDALIGIQQCIEAINNAVSNIQVERFEFYFILS